MALFLCFTGCRKELYDVPLPSEIKKSDRESIGVYVADVIRNDNDIVFLGETETNQSAFDLVQQLYDQATFTMRLDNKSPESNKWQSDRNWQINILKEPTQRAFIIPGGDLYISTGMLQALQSESELFYLLTTEAILMNDKYLLNEMIGAYSTRTLVQIAQGIPTTDQRVETITTEIPLFEYDLSIADGINSKVSEEICATSIYSPNAAQQLLERLSKTEQWLMTRPVGLSEFIDSEECGELVSKGLYESMVLDVL